jgi:hypothetical protein
MVSRVSKTQLVSPMKPAIRTVIKPSNGRRKAGNFPKGTILGWNWRQTPAETHRKEREGHHNYYSIYLIAAIVAQKLVYGELHDNLVPRMR